MVHYPHNTHFVRRFSFFKFSATLRLALGIPLWSSFLNTLHDNMSFQQGKDVSQQRKDGRILEPSPSRHPSFEHSLPEALLRHPSSSNLPTPRIARAPCVLRSVCVWCAARCSAVIHALLRPQPNTLPSFCSSMLCALRRAVQRNDAENSSGLRCAKIHLCSLAPPSCSLADISSTVGTLAG